MKWELCYFLLKEKMEHVAKTALFFWGNECLTDLHRGSRLFLHLSLCKNRVILHVTKQKKQTNKHIYPSYQGLHSLEILWLYWNLQRKISKSIRYLKNKTSQDCTWSKDGPDSWCPLQKECKGYIIEWMRKSQGHSSIKTMEKKAGSQMCNIRSWIKSWKKFFENKSPKLNFESMSHRMRVSYTEDF